MCYYVLLCARMQQSVTVNLGGTEELDFLREAGRCHNMYIISCIIFDTSWSLCTNLSDNVLLFFPFSSHSLLLLLAYNYSLALSIYIHVYYIFIFCVPSIIYTLLYMNFYFDNINH